MNKFIHSLNLDAIIPMAGDLSPRKYFRGEKGGRTSIIMLYPEATDEAREELHDFIKVTTYLAAQGVKVPALMALDEGSACAQFEDLGNKSFGDVRRAGADMTPYYMLACDVLRHLRGRPCPDNLPRYRESKVHHNRRQLVEYYLPLELGRKFTGAEMEGYLAAWDEIETSLPPCPQGFLHMDYHLENLMWVEGEEGIRRCGLIDYQHAVCGPLPYDLVNLLEDARVDVPAALKSAIIGRYCEGLSADEKAAFQGWYDLLAAQFHARVIGLFTMQAVERGRDDYVVHIPRLQKYLVGALEKPALAPFKHWCAQVGLDFAPINDLNGDVIRKTFKSF